jgi:NADH-quinone oxidoreductase subunit N
MPVTETPEIAWRALSPILALTGGAVITLMAGAIVRQVSRLFLAVVTGISLAAALGLSLWSADVLLEGMQGMVLTDGVAVFITAIILGGAGLTTAISFPYLRARRIHRFEFYPLLLIATAGMIMLAQAGDLLMVFIAIEVLSLALYVMVGMARNDSGSREASMKYFLLGAFSSALLLYGVAP